MTRLHSVAGDGVLSRHGDLIMLCAAGAENAAAIDELLRAHEQVARAGGDGAALADGLAAVAAGRGLSLVAFAPAAGSLVVTVFGHGWAVVTTEYGEQRLTPKPAPPEGLRSALPGTVLAIRAGVGEVSTDAPVQRWSDLGQGTTRAGGLLLAVADDVPVAAAPEPPSASPAVAQPAAAPAVADLRKPADPIASAEPPAAESVTGPERVADPASTGPPELPPVAAPDVAVDRSQPFSSVSLLALPPQQEERAPLPIATRPAEPEIADAPLPAHPVPDDHVEVIGVYCKNGHFDDPSARYCAICGISMAQQTLIPRRGPRPPLGVLVLDDGSIFSLDTDYVIGRDPSRDPDVVAGTARPLRIEDPEGLLSRVHARIHLEGWEVAVIDLGSANGTGIWGPYDTVWQRAPAQAPVVVRPGTQVGVGRRQMRYESHRNT